MKRTLRNFWLDIFLFLLLGINIALVSLTQRGSAGTYPGLGWHIHAFLGTLLTLGCLVHIALHWRCFQSILTGKAKGKMKLAMQSMITVMLLLASLSGHATLTSNAAGNFHSFTGSMTLIGLSIHGIRNTRWMVLTARRLTGGQRCIEQMPSSD